MNYQFKGLRISIVIHAVIFLSIIAISKSVVTLSKPVVIDFAIESNQSPPATRRGEQPAISSKKSEPQKQKEEARNQKSEIKEQKKIIEKTAPVMDTHPAPITEAQAPVPAPVQTKQGESKTEGSGAVVNKAVGASGSGAVNYSKNYTAEDRYVKVNFTYIRDIIQKNVTYPYMARKRGLEGKVVISFIVCADGDAQNIAITQSSGFEILDRSAVEAVKKALPFPKPPVKATLIIPVVYKLN